MVGLSVYLFNKFGCFSERPRYVTIATLAGWSLSFLMAFLLPMDLASSKYNSCIANATTQNVTLCDIPYNYVDAGGMKAIWEIVYWSTFVLTWLVFPLMQDYSGSGEFTFWGRMKAAIKLNMLIYGAASLIGVVLVVIIVVKRGSFDAQFLLGVGIAMGNAWGLLILIALLGVGLVEVPRTLFRHSTSEIYLNLLYFRAVSYSNSLFKAQQELLSTIQEVREASCEVSSTHPLYPYMQIIKSKCPSEETVKSMGTESSTYNGVTDRGDRSSRLRSSLKNGVQTYTEVSYDSLVSLHEKLVKAIFLSRRAHVMYNRVLLKAFKYEDVERSKSNEERVILWSFAEERTHRLSKVHNLLEFYWEAYAKKYVLILAYAVFGMCSIVLVWSETTFPFDNSNVTLSIPSLVIQKVQFHDVSLQAMIFLTVAYMAYCAFSTLWKIRIFNYFRLVHHKQSDNNSLLFSANYCCRLIAPLAYNFVLLSGSLGKESAFAQVVGRMDVTVLGTVFATYYPMIILFFFFGSMFHVITRILALFNIKRFRYYDDKFIANDSQIVEGKSLVQRERIRRQREGGFVNNFSKSKLTDRHPLLSNSDSHIDARGSSYNIRVVHSEPSLLSSGQNGSVDRLRSASSIPEMTSLNINNSSFHDQPNSFSSKMSSLWNKLRGDT